METQVFIFMAFFSAIAMFFFSFIFSKMIGFKDFNPFIVILISIGVGIYFMVNRNSVDKKVFTNGSFLLPEVTSGNQFSVYGIGLAKRNFILADTELPSNPDKQETSFQFFTDLILNKSVNIMSSSQDETELEPWAAWLTIDSLNINQLLVKKGLLVGKNSLAKYIPALPDTSIQNQIIDQNSKLQKSSELVVEGVNQTEEKKDSIWHKIIAYAIWIFIGFTGATGLGMVLNKRYFGWITFMTVTGAASFAIAYYLENGGSIIPPSITLAMIFLLGPAGKRANKRTLEECPEFKKYD